MPRTSLALLQVAMLVPANKLRTLRLPLRVMLAQMQSDKLDDVWGVMLRG